MVARRAEEDELHGCILTLRRRAKQAGELLVDLGLEDAAGGVLDGLSGGLGQGRTVDPRLAERAGDRQLEGRRLAGRRGDPPRGNCTGSGTSATMLSV